jgi:hypothetical protein
MESHRGQWLPFVHNFSDKKYVSIPLKNEPFKQNAFSLNCLSTSYYVNKKVEALLTRRKSLFPLKQRVMQLRSSFICKPGKARLGLIGKRLFINLCGLADSRTDVE